MQSKRSSSINRFTSGAIHDVSVRDLQRRADERGWLAEIFRQDELAKEFHPMMAYLSWTEPGIARGPHEHESQSDLFCFAGPSSFKMRMWDNRPGSATHGHLMTLFVGETNPKIIIVPAGVVHAYRNIGTMPGLIINCPNRLYRGLERLEEVDEIRYEDDPDTVFQLD